MMRESLSIYGLSASPGLEALKRVMFTSPHSFQVSLKSYPSLAYPPYCSNSMSSRCPSVRLYEPVTTLLKRPFLTRLEISVCRVL